MRTILRNRKTGHYFQGIADWTDRVAGAFDFQCPERVVRFVVAAGLNVKEMELVLAFKDSRYNIELPLDERWGLNLSAMQNSSEPNNTWPISAAITAKGATEAQTQQISVS